MKKHPKEGRPSLNSNKFQWNKIVQKLEHAFAIGCSIEEACLYAGIAKQSFYNHFHEKPEFLDRFETLKARPVLLARMRWIEAFKEDPKLARDYVIKKRPEEFGGRVRRHQSEFDRLRTTDTPERKEEVKKTLRLLGILLPREDEEKRPVTPSPA